MNKLSFAHKELLAMTGLEKVVLALSYMCPGLYNNFGEAKLVELAKNGCGERGENADQFLRSLNLAEAISFNPLQGQLENWSFDSTRIEQDFKYSLLRTVKYGNQGGSTSRILGYSTDKRYVLTQTGSIYELVREEAAVEAAPKHDPYKDMKIADFEPAYMDYLMNRSGDLKKLIDDMASVKKTEQISTDVFVTFDLGYCKIVEDQKSGMNYPYQITPLRTEDKQPTYCQDMAQVFMHILRKWW